jgi:hypothetical protein
MPAFTFEKISPPENSGPVTAVEQKQRGAIAQLLDRFVVARNRRVLKREKIVIVRRDPVGRE